MQRGRATDPTFRRVSSRALLPRSRTRCAPGFYREHGIELKLNSPAASLDTQGRQVLLADSSHFSYDRLSLATSAEPVRLDIPGAFLEHVYYLRTLADSRAIVEKALISQRAVVIGAGFIGLEVGSSLRARNVDVHAR